MTEIRALIKRMGGPSAVARIAGVAQSTIHSWTRIPADHAAALEAVTGVPRWEMRPEDWHAVWPEIIGRKGAPKVPKQ